MVPHEPQLGYWKAITRIVRCFLLSLTYNDISPLELATWPRRIDPQVRKTQDLSLDSDSWTAVRILEAEPISSRLSWSHLRALVASITSLSGHHPVGQSQSFEALLRSTDWGAGIGSYGDLEQVVLVLISLHSDCHTPHPKHHCHHLEDFP